MSYCERRYMCIYFNKIVSNDPSELWSNKTFVLLEQGASAITLTSFASNYRVIGLIADGGEGSCYIPSIWLKFLEQVLYYKLLLVLTSPILLGSCMRRYWRANIIGCWIWALTFDARGGIKCFGAG